MHFIFSYDLSIAAGSRRNEIENKILNVLPTNNFTRQLNNFFIVKCEREEDWKDILNKLVELSNSIPEMLRFIMSCPSEDSERYDGMLPQGSWERVNQITNEDNNE